MIIFIHGDNQVDSRQKLSELVKCAHDKEIVRLGEVNITNVKQALEATSLFAEDKLVVIENLLGGRKKNSDVWEYLKKGEYDCDLVLWEGKKVDARKLGWIKKVGKIEEFSYPKILFKLLESVGVSDKREILELFEGGVEQMPVELLYFMLVRQFRLLVLVANNAADAGIRETANLQSWMLGKLKRQVEYIGRDKVGRLYKQLLYINYQHKSGQSSLDLRQTLDIWLSQVS